MRMELDIGSREMNDLRPARSAASENLLELRYPPSLRRKRVWAFWGCIAFTALGLYGALDPSQTGRIAAAALALGFGAGAVYLVVTHGRLRSRFIVSRAGIARLAPDGTETAIPWDSIAKVRHRPFAEQLVISSTDAHRTTIRAEDGLELLDYMEHCARERRFVDLDQFGNKKRTDERRQNARDIRQLGWWCLGFVVLAGALRAWIGPDDDSFGKLQYFLVLMIGGTWALFGFRLWRGSKFGSSPDGGPAPGYRRDGRFAIDLAFACSIPVLVLGVDLSATRAIGTALLMLAVLIGAPLGAAWWSRRAK